MDHESQGSYIMKSYGGERLDTAEDRPSSVSHRMKKIHRRVSTQVNNSGILNPQSIAIETLSPVNNTRRNTQNFFRERTSDRYGGRHNTNTSDIERKPSTSSNYRIRKIGPKLLGGE